jgi:hypothetical protein
MSQNLIQATDRSADNIALLTTAIKDATAQAGQSAESSSRLAKSLNRITFMLVVVGLLQVVATVIITWHH